MNLSRLVFYMFFILGLNTLSIESAVAQVDPSSLSIEDRIVMYEASLKYKFTEEEKKESSKALGLVEGSRHEKVILGKEQRIDWSEDVEQIKIAKHIRSDKGEQLPTKQEVINSRPKNQVNEKEFSKKFSEEYLPLIAEQIEEENQFKPLSKCASSKTTKEKIGVVKGETGSLPVTDILFIQSELVPEDLDEVLGETVMVYSYYEDRDVQVHMAARGMNVNCLPTRFRSTSNYLFVDTGENALKNYSDNYHGSGKLHEFFK